MILQMPLARYPISRLNGSWPWQIVGSASVAVASENFLETSPHKGNEWNTGAVIVSKSDVPNPLPHPRQKRIIGWLSTKKRPRSTYWANVVSGWDLYIETVLALWSPNGTKTCHQTPTDLWNLLCRWSPGALEVNLSAVALRPEINFISKKN